VSGRVELRVVYTPEGVRIADCPAASFLVFPHGPLFTRAFVMSGCGPFPRGFADRKSFGCFPHGFFRLFRPTSPAF